MACVNMVHCIEYGDRDRDRDNTMQHIHFFAHAQCTYKEQLPSFNLILKLFSFARCVLSFTHDKYMAFSMRMCCQIENPMEHRERMSKKRDRESRRIEHKYTHKLIGSEMRCRN